MAVKILTNGDRLAELQHELEAVCQDTQRRTFAPVVAVFFGCGALPPAIIYQRMKLAGLDDKAW